LTELLKTLVGKELLTADDVRNVLQRAIQEISGAATEPTMRARSLIENELLPQFRNAIRSAALVWSKQGMGPRSQDRPSF
jgi:hypothetical protein